MNVILDDGYRFGLGAFETICLLDGRPQFLPDHLARLKHTLRFLGIDRTVDEAVVAAWLAEQPLSDLPTLHGLKIMVSPENLIFSFRSNPYTAERKQQGFRVGISDVQRNETSLLTFHKTLNYAENIMEKRKAAQNGLDEVLFFNTKGQLCEGSTTNVFLVKNGEIRTPDTACGLLPGVMRQQLLRLPEVQTAILTADDLDSADEVFLSNALMGIMPVTALNGKPLPAGPVTARLAHIIAQKEISSNEIGYHILGSD